MSFSSNIRRSKAARTTKNPRDNGLQNPNPWSWPANNKDWIEKIVIDDVDDLPLNIQWQEITYI